MIRTKFTIGKKGNIRFVSTIDKTKQRITIEKVKNLDEILEAFLSKLKLNIFNILELVRNGFAKQHLSTVKGKKTFTLELNGVTFSGTEGMDLGSVLASNPNSVLTALHDFHINYLDKEYKRMTYEFFDI